MTLLIIYVLIALGFSFLCSILEATLLTLSPTTIETARRQGKTWAKHMEILKSDIDRPLSAILTLNTIAHTMGAAGAGSRYQQIYGDATESIFAAALTLAILVFTEIIPKTIGARFAVQLAAPTAWVLPKLQLVLAPLVWLCRQITRLITFGKADAAPPHREELIAVAHLGEKHGALKKSESAVVRNILRLNEITVGQIMTPRPVVFMLPADMELQDFVEASAAKPFSRIPIYDEDPEKVGHFVIRADVLYAYAKDRAGTLAMLKRPLRSVPKHVSVENLLERLMADGDHIMIVHDEFGTIVGLVTLEDVLETIMGVEIMDEQDTVEDMQKLARDHLARKGSSGEW